jgi:hypothetical protein
MMPLFGPKDKGGEMPLSIRIEAAIFLLGFFVVVPTIAAAIGYAAWKGEPKTWDRSMYWTAFAASIAACAFLWVYAQRMQADTRTWWYPLQLFLFGLGVLLFGVAGGCLVGVFTYRRGKGAMWRVTSPTEPTPEDLERNR